MTRAQLVALGAALAALAVSIYLTIEHFDQHLTLACPETGTINCAKVTTSKWSHLAGIPVAVLGPAYFVLMTTVLLTTSVRRELQTLPVVLASGGVVMVLYPVCIELFRVDAICLWCSAVHALTLIMFAATLWSAANETRATE